MLPLLLTAGGQRSTAGGQQHGMMMASMLTATQALATVATASPRTQSLWRAPLVRDVLSCMKCV